MGWNPDQYLKFAQPRLRPALDLIARIPSESPNVVYDLGCGTGNITRLLAKRWPSARITGVDDSAEMLAKAAEIADGIHWQQRSLLDWKPDAKPSVIFSNAALHWLPNHAQVLPALVDVLAPGGVLALQMPRNFLAPSHTLIHETIRSGPWRARLEPMISAPPVSEPCVYYSLLQDRARSLDIWETEYLQVLEGKDPVKEWTKGTWLKQFLDALDEPERSEFESDYARRLTHAYPMLSSGTTLFPFRRLFIVLERK